MIYPTRLGGTDGKEKIRGLFAFKRQFISRDLNVLWEIYFKLKVDEA